MERERHPERGGQMQTDRDSVSGMRRFEDKKQGSDREKDDSDSERACVRACVCVCMGACAHMRVCVGACVCA